MQVSTQRCQEHHVGGDVLAASRQLFCEAIGCLEIHKLTLVLLFTAR